MNIFIQSLAKTLGFFLAILIFIVFLGIIIKLIDDSDNLYFDYIGGQKNSSDVIAILNINGPIISEPKKLYSFEVFTNLKVIYPSLIEKYLSELEKQNIKGLIVSINSPGGSVSASQKIYSLMKNFKEKNKIPLYMHSTDILASGGYWIGLAGDKIFAEYGTLIGSIGVKGPNWLYYNSPTSISSGILGNSVESPNGIKLYSNTAGIYKDIFNPFRKPSKKELLKLQQMVDDIYDDFVNLVSSNRKIERQIIKNEIGAMIFNTKRSKQNFLIDDEKNIKEITEYMSKKLKLNEMKIISNKNERSLELLNLNISSFIGKSKLIDNHKLIIKEKFCNNFFNEFSSISTSISYFEC